MPGLVALVVGPEGMLYQEAFGKLDVAGNTPMPKDSCIELLPGFEQRIYKNLH